MKKVVVNKKKVITNEVIEMAESIENNEPFEHVDERPGYVNNDHNVASNNYMNL